MLAVTANWAISDGSVVAPPTAAVFSRLLDDVRLATVRAGFRRDGRYHPVDRLVLVLAGDTLDGLLSRRWLGRVRPWERRRQTVEVRAEILRAAWRHARRPVAGVARLARRGVMVPEADRHGRPNLSRRISVPVHVAILLGDRDGDFARVGAGLAWRRHAVGVGHSWDERTIHVLHGDAIDPLGVRDGGPTVAESLIVDLLARFGAAITERESFSNTAGKIARSLAHGRVLDMPLRLAEVLRVACPGVDAPWIIDAWHRSVDHWERAARRSGCGCDPAIIDAISGWMHSLDDHTTPVLEDVISTLVPILPDGHRGIDRLTVLGHPGAIGPMPAGRVVCLGPPSVRRSHWCGVVAGPGDAASCVETGFATTVQHPPVVAIFEDGEGIGGDWEWISQQAWPRPSSCEPSGRPILDAA